MLISPMLFFLVARALLVARRAGAIRTGRGTVEELARAAGSRRGYCRREIGGRLDRTRRDCMERAPPCSVAAAASSLRRTHQMQDAAIVPCLRPARAQGDQRAMKTGSAGVQESVEARRPSLESPSSAIRDGRRHDPVREAMRGAKAALDGYEAGQGKAKRAPRPASALAMARCEARRRPPATLDTHPV